ncbi:hypothetical protein [Streptomyces chryseus]
MALAVTAQGHRDIATEAPQFQPAMRIQDHLQPPYIDQQQSAKHPSSARQKLAAFIRTWVQTFIMRTPTPDRTPAAEPGL